MVMKEPLQTGTTREAARKGLVDQSGGSTAHSAAPLIILGLLLGSTLFGEELSELSIHVFFATSGWASIAWVEAMEVDPEHPRGS